MGILDFSVEYSPPPDVTGPPIEKGKYTLVLDAEGIGYLWALSFLGEGGDHFPTDRRLVDILEEEFELDEYAMIEWWHDVRASGYRLPELY
jgi:hypothetical protein